MKSFRLETLLKLRNALRRGQQAQLAACQQALAKTQVTRREVAAQLDQARQQQAITTSTGRLSGTQLRANHQFIQDLQEQQQRLKTQENELLQQLQAQRERYNHADGEAKALENLRKRQAVGDARISARLETRELDQVAQRTSGHIA
ncbi:MAG: flagellar FliJ family protein [Planctomycetota bacterium]|nr:flagellar FliJ family protein [Planctomycetota bacterium]